MVKTMLTLDFTTNCPKEDREPSLTLTVILKY